jgi:hypothetical protein
MDKETAPSQTIQSEASRRESKSDASVRGAHDPRPVIAGQQIAWWAGNAAEKEFSQGNR